MFSRCPMPELILNLTHLAGDGLTGRLPPLGRLGFAVRGRVPLGTEPALVTGTHTPHPLATFLHLALPIQIHVAPVR